MSSHPTDYNSHGRPFRQSPTSDSHSAFPISDLPVHNNRLYPYPTQQRSTTPASSQQDYHPHQASQQQTQLSYDHSSQSRHYGGQAYGSHNIASTPSGSADRRRHPPLPPPLDVPQELEEWQGSQYHSTHADLQTQHTSNDVHSPHAVYPPSPNHPPYQSQYQSFSATAYSAGHNRAPLVATASQKYHQHLSMSTSERTMPSSRTSTRLPYARPDNFAEEVVLPEPAGPVIKKKRKRADARQIEKLDATYARTAFPSTDERAALAKELDMSARSVQIWFQNKRLQAPQGERNTAGTSNSGPEVGSGKALSTVSRTSDDYRNGRAARNSNTQIRSLEPIYSEVPHPQRHGDHIDEGPPPYAPSGSHQYPVPNAGPSSGVVSEREPPARPETRQMPAKPQQVVMTYVPAPQSPPIVSEQPSAQPTPSVRRSHSGRTGDDGGHRRGNNRSPDGTATNINIFCCTCPRSSAQAPRH